MLRADLIKMFQMNWFKICTLFMLMIAGMLIFMQKTAMDYTVSIDRVLFLPMSMYGIASAVLVSMITGSDYEGGFIRNKVFAGNTRKSIYVSNEISNVVGGLLMYVITILFTILISFGLFKNNITLAMFFKFFFLGAFTCFAYVCIFSMISMLIGHRATSGVICMVLAFVMLFLSLYSNSIIAQKDFSNIIIELLYDINPTGQVAQISSMQCLNPVRVIVIDMIWFFITNIIGIYIFKHKDLK